MKTYIVHHPSIEGRAFHVNAKNKKEAHKLALHELGYKCSKLKKEKRK